jgi:hypothetical protein
VVAGRTSRHGRLYSIRGSDSPATAAAVRVNVAVVFAIVSALFGALVAAFRPRASLVLEIIVLRLQLAVLKRARPRPPVRPIDRAFWVVVSRVWSRWGDALAIVKPATVIAWHRRGFARFWAWKSRRVGRPVLATARIRSTRRRLGHAALR